MSALSLCNVCKCFGSKQVLDDVCLDFEEGEMVGLIGASGSGKSTLIRMIAGLETIDAKSGTDISIFGEKTQIAGKHTDAMKRVRKDLGIIFQQFNLVTRLSLLTNVLTGRLGHIPRWRGTLGLFPEEDKIKALQALERVGMIEFAHQRASTLSGGQQQRGAIARALTQEARMILADEPIASLDPASAKLVMSTLREINRTDKVTVIVSLHQIDHAFTHCDRIVALKDGCVIHDGATSSITPQDISELYGVSPDGLDGNSLDVTPKKPGPSATDRPEKSGAETDSNAGGGFPARPDLAAQVANA
ncbi:MAG: phosphonate ABC transporter ATP-binding protein [Magnetovibrionaceae bacterium]